VANANPAQSLANVTAAGAGTAVDLAGAATGVSIPSVISMVVSVSSMTSSWDKVSAPAYVTVGLEVSLDGTNYVRIGAVQCNANGQFSVVKQFPARYARGSVDTLDPRISTVAINGWVAGGT
jgi:hypothetical protein